MQPINVLQFICPSGLYGAEMWILALTKYLDPEKICSKLVVTEETENQNLQIKARFQELGLSVYSIKMGGRFDPKALVKLSCLIKSQHIEIIHTHGYKSDILGWLAAKMNRIKIIGTPHGFANAPDRKLQFYIHLGCLALRHFDRVVPLSKELETELKRRHIPEGQMRLITNGVDLEEIDRERRRGEEWLGSSSSGKTIGYIGQLSHRKNIIDMLRTFDLLYKDHQDIRLILIGDGFERSEFEGFSKKLASGERIEFLGYRDDRLSWLKKMDLFTMTSSLEGIPRSMMEAMAMGVPVAAFEIPGISELIIQGKTGLMAPFGNIATLKDCWERILFNKIFSAEMADNGRKYVFDRFSAKTMAENYMRLYRDIIPMGKKG
jgi:glycosyltransferase involved in cell wall biosynthesis